jgi:hypothetical protein
MWSRISMPFMEPKCFFTMFTAACYWTIPWIRWIHSTFSHSISFRSILILSSYLHLCLPHGLLPSSFLTKILYAFLISPSCGTSQLPWFDDLNNIWWRVRIMELLSMQFSTASPYFFSVSSKYSPKHPVFKCPQSMLNPYGQTPSFTHIQNSKYN